MNEALPDGLQMTELGPLPKEWRVVRLGEGRAVDRGNTSATRALYGPPGYRAFGETGPEFFESVEAKG